MASRRTSLSGSWSGAFRYPGDTFPETVFSAQIEERDGVFFGATQEPSTTPWRKGRVLRADIEGMRNGASVVFTKFYEQSAGIDFAIRYEGEADEVLTRIDGVWINPEWSGPFFMVRDDEGRQAEAKEAAESAVKGAD